VKEWSHQATDQQKEEVPQAKDQKVMKRPAAACFERTAMKKPAAVD
jgi:hypothetical protein